MKINLIMGDGPSKTGYKNVRNVQNLDMAACDAEVTEILAIDVIDYIPINETNKTLDHWVSKLRMGGKLIVGGVDAFSVAKAFSVYQISIDEYNELVHGGDKPRLVSLTMGGLISYFEQKHGLKIIKKRYDGFSYLIEVERTTNE